MTSPIAGIAIPTMPTVGAVDATQATAAGGTAATSGASGFAGVLTSQIDQLNAVQSNVDSLAAQAATGDLKDAHDYMIASTEASLATDMVVTLRNKGVEAFNEIMRMQI